MFDNLISSENIPFSISQSLSVLQDDEFGKLVCVLFDQSSIIRHDSASLRNSRILPGFESFLGVLNSKVELRLWSLRNLGDEFVVGRVDDVIELSGLRGDPLSLDVVLVDFC